jgi:uncharacterized protein (TIGR02145 family)
MKLFSLFAPFAVFSALMFVACGDDSSSTNAITPPDGDGWSEPYDQPKSSAIGNSSSSGKDAKNSSSSSDKMEGSSSSRPTEIFEPELKVNETCSEKGACDAMLKTDVGTWHFVRKDAFGKDAEYTYKAEGRDLIVTIKNADGTTDSKTYSMYNMESEVGVEMAFNAAKSTCKDGGGNDRIVNSCVKDSVIALPDCDEELEGFLALKDSVYRICKSNSWTKATAAEYDTYGFECFDDGRLVNGKVNTETKYVCASGKFRAATNEELDYGLACVTGNENALVEAADSVLKKCQEQKWVDASAFDYNTYKQECGEKNLGQIIKGRKAVYSAADEWYYRYYCTADGWVDITFWSWDIPNEVRLNPDIDYQLMTDSRDGQVYRTVKIGGQTWMAENLNYADSVRTPSLKGYSLCYQDDSTKCNAAGRLYLYETIEKNDEYPLCPNGWRLPDTTDWNALIEFVASSKSEGARGQYLCSQSGWNMSVARKGCSDDFGFSALPIAGQSISYELDDKMQLDGSYHLLLTESKFADACFWASTIDDDWIGYYVCLSNSIAVPEVKHKERWSMHAYSIRCVKDE